MDYDLVGLGPIEFEKLAISLCLEIFGPGCEVFGAGPDGGREMTIQGRIAMPDNLTGAHWDGYSVVQAKHKARLEGATKDVAWLTEQIRREFTSWHSPNRLTRKPEYFLLITNVRLSAVAERGGIDIANSALAEQARSIGLKGWAIWHHDKVVALLRNHQRIRQEYLGAITTSDVLKSMDERLPPPRPRIENFINLEIA